jgi:uncharacterized DUF497 family protein
MPVIYTILNMETVSLPEFEGFDWDPGNVEKNWLAHQVTPQECEQLFFNRPLIAADDAKHSRTEKRFFVLGQTDEDRPLFIAFTVRKKRIRVISARDMNRKERKVYSL